MEHNRNHVKGYIPLEAINSYEEESHMAAKGTSSGPLGHLLQLRWRRDVGLASAMRTGEMSAVVASPLFMEKLSRSD